MKKLAFFLMLSLASSLGYERDYVISRKDSGYVYNASFEEGCQDLKKLSQLNSDEDLWLYSDKWFDVGFQGDKNGVKPDRKLIKNITSGMKEFSIVHIHPLEPNDAKIYPPSTYGDLDQCACNIEVPELEEKKVRYFVVDEKGLWEYSLSEKAKNSLILSRKDNSLKDVSDDVDEIYERANKDFKDRDKAIEYIIENCRLYGVYLSYKKL